MKTILKYFISSVVGIFLLLSIPILFIGIPAQWPHDFEMCMAAKGNIAQMEAGAGYYVEDWCYEEGFVNECFKGEDCPD